MFGEILFSTEVISAGRKLQDIERVIHKRVGEERSPDAPSPDCPVAMQSGIYKGFRDRGGVSRSFRPSTTQVPSTKVDLPGPSQACSKYCFCSPRRVSFS
jgi:hypothetical protein